MYGCIDEHGVDHFHMMYPVVEWPVDLVLHFVTMVFIVGGMTSVLANELHIDLMLNPMISY